ncbi:GNAT family N-acetyltransferase [Sphingomonas sp. ERG5]|uniref:GNAT family N-acetyltransferase n=1 Tax=Sphingomonas sp. ERG5 TaxID=1381597 RepID=UPI00054C0E51|nr:GNAT family N-acetyltransferase [Sphingomonas sp. ERG5]
MTATRILYASEPALAASDFRHVLIESGLGAIRPVDDAERLATMLKEADLVLTARLDRADGALVGVMRAITDYSWSCYVSELAVTPAAQGLGVGRGLLDETRRQLGPAVSVILASVPEAVGFYERIGMARQADAFWYRRER